MKIRSDLGKLDNFVRSNKTFNDWKVRVGIFSNRTERMDDEEMDNAAIGAAHELGSFERKLPIRSWLLMPLRVSQREIIREITYGLIQKMAHFGVVAILKDLGFACENAILAAFKSGGFGTWKPLKPATIKRKGSSAILIDTGQLRRAVASQVVKA